MMNRNYGVIAIYCISGVIGVFSEFFGDIRVSYLILLILLAIDTLAGIARGIKCGKFNSRGLKRFVKKIITYSTAIITVRLLEIGILPLYETTMLSQIMAAFLEITETISILEHMAFLGVPVPANLLGMLAGNLRMPGLGRVLTKKTIEEDYLSEIDDMIRYQIPTLSNEHARRLLEINLEIWKTVTIQVNNVLEENGTGNRELLYYKILSLIESGFREMEEVWKDEVPARCVAKFKEWHQPRLDKWLNKIREICYSHESADRKRRTILENIIILLYQNIIDAQKGISCPVGIDGRAG